MIGVLQGIEWLEYEVTDLASALNVLRRFKRHLSKGWVTAAGFDTETTGLNPVRSMPFLYQCGWYSEEKSKGITIILELDKIQPNVSRLFIKAWQNLTAKAPVYLGHHIVFDMHMMSNFGTPLNPEVNTNITDTQFYIRASSDAVQVDKGGEPLGLKDWATRHITKDAKDFEKELKQERTKIAQAYNKQLQVATGWKKRAFDDFFKDKLNEACDLPPEIQDAYARWHDSLPAYLQPLVSSTVESDMIRYDTLNRDNVKKYGHLDVVYTLLCYRLCCPVVKVRQNEELICRESEQLYYLRDMEREGFDVDAQYILDCKAKMRAYILRRRKDLDLLAGQHVDVGQHALIKTILKEQFCMDVESTGQEQLEQLVSDLKRDNEHEDCIEFIETLLELRTLQKWYSTYIRRFEIEIKDGPKIYTSINQVGAVSGRVTCDFQQFPKGGIVTIDGEELFHPRKMIIVTEEYPAIVYLDYSQVELRLQALYTYLLGEADLNLCRAYMPYKCHRQDGTPYNPETDGKLAYDGGWYLDESNEPWTPTDVHGATTKHAFDITEDDPRFHDLRYVGKRVNFAKNYGASLTRISQMFPEYSIEQCKKIDEAYYKAFPGVKKYHEACFQWANLPYMDNLYGIKYYGVSGHNLRNTLVQGSAAYFLKDRIVAVNKYLHEHKCKSKWIMQIHDELQFKWSREDDPKIFFDIKEIMQDSESQVPIIADMEVTTTNWKNKVEVENYEQLCEICNWRRP